MNVLVVASHPDDEILGCGGTIAKHIKNGDKVTVLLLSQGRVSLDEIYAVEASIGAKYIIAPFTAQQFEMTAQSVIADFIAKTLREAVPEVVYTHSPNDLNKDHKVAYEATLVATRPNTDYSPLRVYSYEIMGSNFQPQPFNPTHYTNIVDTIDDKITAMGLYKEEMNEYPQPRSIGGILIYSEFRGLECGMKYSEAFETIRTVNL